MNNNAKGYSKHPLYKVYVKMMERCYYPKEKSFTDYGGRGIKVCNSWKNNRVTFIEWALTNGWERGLEIDRIDVNGNYEPDNIRFVTRKANANNKRSTRITVDDWYMLHRLDALGAKRKDLATLYDVTPTRISQILKHNF